jgi:hypothetical protein
MGYGKTLEALNSGAGSKVWQKVFSEALKEGGRNAVVAGVQTVGENAIAKTIYDKDRKYLDNVRERITTAFSVGALTKANLELINSGVEVIAKVRSGTNPQTLAKTRRVFNISKEQISVKVGEFQNSASLAKAKLQNKANEVIQKVKVTDAEAVQAKKVIREYAKNQPLYSSIYLGIVEPKLANAYRKVGQKVIQDGYTKFKEFSGEMVKTVGAKVKPHLAKLFSELSNENVFKANKSEIEVFKTKESELKAKFESIEEFRKTNKLPEFSYPKNAKGEVTGTVAYLEADGKKVFGTNTTIGREKLGTDNAVLRKEAITDIQNKLGKLKGDKYGVDDAKFLTHAEAEALIKLAKKNGGKLPEELTMYVDRPTCSDCRGRDGEVGKGLSLLTELYGVKKLTVYDSYGTKYIIKPNQATEIIK